jgi:hypothetical protein
MYNASIIRDLEEQLILNPRCCLSRSGETRLFLFVVLLLAPVAGHGQNDGAIPDAPSVAAAKTYPAQAVNLPAFDDLQPTIIAEPPEQLPAIEWEPASDPSEDSIPAGDTAPGLRIDLDKEFAAMGRPTAFDAYAAGDDTEHYHWKGLLSQSFAFFGVENAFRLMTDPYFRHLTADGPFWHDYISSLDNWNWRRWNDGDDFLVAYIGHPMQGSVTEFIEIQNDPHARNLRIGTDRAYWKSIFHSFLWNTLYSTDQKLGPLGESALGSEGGYTYVIGCPAPCKSYNPAIDKVTNNTGWVKLVSTPFVGTLWTLMEDFLDRFVSDPVQNHFGQDRVFPKILRGSLNPCRTMANFLRWRKPWYRDFQDNPSDQRITRRFDFLPSDEAFVRATPRFELFPHFNAISLPVNTATCLHCRQMTTGSGIGFSSRLTKRVDFDSDLDYQPNASPVPSDRAGGNILMGTFGLRSGFQTRHFALKGSLRPGFVSYDRAYETSPTATGPKPEIGRITHFATALALNGDLNLNRHVALRGVFGNTPVRYREPYLTTPDKWPYLNWLSRKIFLTNENWAWQAGPVLRF